jgi:hypothetical protein
MKTALSIQALWALWAIVLHAQFTSADSLDGADCGSRPPQDQLACYQQQCPMPGPPGFSCASYPPPDQLDCYRERCHDVYTSSSTSSATATSSATQSDDGSVTSIIYATSLVTITSCGPEVTNCPAGKGSSIITSSVISYTTVCPVSNQPLASIKTAANQGAIATSSGETPSTDTNTSGQTTESTGPEIFTGGAVGNRLAGWGLVVALAVVGGLLC